jgi:hypothetical protein
LLAANGVVDCRTDSAHDLIINTTEWSRERALQNGVKAVAIDDRGLVDACVDMVEIDLRGQASFRCGNLGDGCKSPRINYFRSSEQQNWSALLADLSQPDLASPHG